MFKVVILPLAKKDIMKPLNGIVPNNQILGKDLPVKFAAK